VDERGAVVHIGGEGEGSRGVGVVEARAIELSCWGVLLDVGLVGVVGLRVEEINSVIRRPVGGWRGV
jgi:hypothetical protein